jgi:transposase
VTLYTAPPPQATVICVDELGPVTPRFFPPIPAWSITGHRIKSQLEYGRGTQKAWVYGGLLPQTGQTVTLTTTGRNSTAYCEFLALLEQTFPEGRLLLIVDNLASHTSQQTMTWLQDHPRLQQVFLPKKAPWLNLIEGWWRLLRREAFAGMDLADVEEVSQVVQKATAHLNSRAKPWIWQRSPKPVRVKRRLYLYRI